MICLILQFIKLKHIRAVYVLAITILTFFACSTPDSTTKEAYKGINNKDTAYLTLHIENDSFYGKYAIHGPNHIKKIGDIQGFIHGDTLIGDFYFKHHRTKVKKREPIALLKQDSKLLVGRGKYYFYIGIPFFDSKVPINYDNPAFALSKH